MKIAFSAEGDSLESPLDPRFGRCRNFIIYDDSSDSFVSIGNEQNLNATQGAGIQAAQNVARSGAECVVSGHFGPKAFKTLSAAGIKPYTCEFRTVAEALDAFKNGKLKEMSEPDIEGHWV